MHILLSDRCVKYLNKWALAGEAKGLSQKEVALACKMDTANYSRIESGKTDPAFSSVIKIAKAMDVELIDLFQAGV